MFTLPLFFDPGLCGQKSNVGIVTDKTMLWNAHQSQKLGQDILESLQSNASIYNITLEIFFHSAYFSLNEMVYFF
jgi:hypothetical protein